MRQHIAGLDRFAVYMHGACAALRRIAPSMRPCEPEHAAQQVGEKRFIRHIQPMKPAVDRDRQRGYHAVTPPSTGTTAPVKNDDSSLIKKTMAAAISSGVANRFKSCRPVSLGMSASRSPGEKPARKSRDMGVSMPPGQMTLQRI